MKRKHTTVKCLNNRNRTGHWVQSISNTHRPKNVKNLNQKFVNQESPTIELGVEGTPLVPALVG